MTNETEPLFSTTTANIDDDTAAALRDGGVTDDLTGVVTAERVSEILARPVLTAAELVEAVQDAADTSTALEAVDE